MFNQEIKEKYLEGKPEKTAVTVKNLLVAAESFEIKYGKDIAEFSAGEFSEFMCNCGFCEPDSVRTRQGAIASYADWYCNEMGIKGHHIRRYSVSDFPFAKFFASVVTKTPEELVNKILQVYDADSAQPAMAALCLAWLGIDLKDAVLLKKEQVDTVHGKIYDQTGAVVVAQMPDIIREILDIYGKTYAAERTQNQTFTVYADDCGYFIKKMKTLESKKESGPISTKRMMAYILSLKDLFNGTERNDQTLTYANVLRSGNFYRLHQMAKSGVDVYSTKNADKVRLCLGPSKRNHKDNMIMYNAYLEVIGEK